MIFFQPSTHHTQQITTHHHDPALLIDSASSSIRQAQLNPPSETKDEVDHHLDPKMKIYPWMRRMHASQSKRGKGFELRFYQTQK